MPTSPAALTAILLTERGVRGDAPPLSAAEFWALARQVDVAGLADLADLPDRGLPDPLDLGRSRVVDRARLDTLLARSTAMAFELDRLAQSGIAVLSALDDRYPGRLLDRLGDAAPPLLYVAGEPELLAREGLAIVGSRGVTEHGANVARRAARLAVGEGVTVVSGGARGVDQLAMSAAREADGVVLGVLAEGLDQALRSRETRAAVLEGRALLCSPYSPTAGFSVGNAMARNKLVYALSRLAFVVATDEGSGGTWAGATEALGKGYAPVAVWTGEGAGPGNAALVERGAQPVEHVDDLAELLAAAQTLPVTAGPGAVTTPTQLGFDLTG